MLAASLSWRVGTCNFSFIRLQWTDFRFVLITDCEWNVTLKRKNCSDYCALGVMRLCVCTRNACNRQSIAYRIVRKWGEYFHLKRENKQASRSPTSHTVHIQPDNNKNEMSGRRRARNEADSSAHQNYSLSELRSLQILYMTCLYHNFHLIFFPTVEFNFFPSAFFCLLRTTHIRPTYAHV